MGDCTNSQEPKDQIHFLLHSFRRIFACYACPPTSLNEKLEREKEREGGGGRKDDIPTLSHSLVLSKPMLGKRSMSALERLPL